MYYYYQNNHCDLQITVIILNLKYNILLKFKIINFFLNQED